MGRPNGRSALPGPKTVAGFTLIEILIAIFVFSVVMTMVMSVFIAGLRSRSEGALNLALEREGSNVLERIMRGIDGIGGLREADKGEFWVDDLNRDQVWYRVDRNATPTSSIDDDTWALVYYWDGEIYCHPDMMTPQLETLSNAEGHVESLQFFRTTGGVNIELKMSAPIPGGDRRAFVHLTKSVALRN